MVSISWINGVRKIVRILTASGLFTPDEIKMVWDYFEWKSDEALKLERRNLDNEKKELLAVQLWLVRNEMFQTAVMAGNLYYALGVVDADSCIPDVCWEDREAVSEPVKMVSTFVYNMGKQYAKQIRKPFLRMVMNMACNSSELIKKAYENKKDGDRPDKIILLTVYFFLKYPQADPRNPAKDFAEFLEQQKCPKEEREQELALMRQYEEQFVQNFRKIYDEKPSEQALAEVEAALREGRVDDRIRELALNHAKRLDVLWEYAMALAFVNFALSPRLRNVVSVCIAVSPWDMLYDINRVDMREDFRNWGGNIDEMFGVDSATLITCAANNEKENILKEQFKRNREIYLKCMDTRNIACYHYMSQVIKQVEPAFHKEREPLELARQREELMATYTVSMNEHRRREMRKYLSGETGVEALYAFAENCSSYADWVYQEKAQWEAMGHYRKAYGYDTLCKRCEAALMVCGKLDVFSRDYLFDCDYLFDEVVVDKERIKEIFRAMEEEQITLHSQLDGFLQIQDAVECEKEVLKDFTEVGKEIFGAYLEKQPGKMLEVFREAEVPGRIFGLQVLVKRKELPKDILCSFALDKSKEVREALVDILGKVKGYEKNVMEMLASRKVTEREVAVKVLINWAGKQSGKKYVPILKDALIKENNARIRTLLMNAIPVEVQERAQRQEQEQAQRQEQQEQEQEQGQAQERVQGQTQGQAQERMQSQEQGQAQERVQSQEQGQAQERAQRQVQKQVQEQTQKQVQGQAQNQAQVQAQSQRQEQGQTQEQAQRPAPEGNKTAPDIDIVKELHKGNRKRSLAWAYETPFPTVHYKTGEEASQEYLQAIFLAYASMSLKGDMVSEDDMAARKAALKSGGPYYVNSMAAALAQVLNRQEFALYVWELLEKWVIAGSETRKRWVLYAAALHGDAETTEKICQLMPEWAEENKTVAVEALRALAYGLTPRGLLFVDGIVRKKVKIRKVRSAAEKTLKTVAAQFGTTREGLLDITVPDFGFDEGMRRLFDYGQRKFYVTITTALETEVFDEKGKKLKSMPAPGKQDDGGKAAVAYEDFKLLKKQMKEAAAFQKNRMETALSDGREWSIAAWKDLFVKNPIMHQFAIGLIWGIYEDGKLVSGFRYMEDGSFNTEDGNEIHLMDEDVQEGEMPRKAVKIVHPLELAKKSLDAWREQLRDYEIIQPISQIDRDFYPMEEEEKKQKKLDRFDGYEMDYDVLTKQLTKLGWRETWYEDVNYIYSKENDELSMRVDLELRFDFYEEYATIYDAKFYKIEGGEEPREEDACLLGDVPERYFSEIVMQLDSVTEADI